MTERDMSRCQIQRISGTFLTTVLRPADLPEDAIPIIMRYDYESDCIDIKWQSNSFAMTWEGAPFERMSWNPEETIKKAVEHL